MGLGARFDHFRRSCPGGSSSAVAIIARHRQTPGGDALRRPTGARSTRRPACRCCGRWSKRNRDLQTTAVVITHNADIARMADRVLTMANRRIVEERRNAAQDRRCGAALVKAIHRKALRDLWHMRGQALAIALVIASALPCW